MLNIELKNVKYAAFASEETNCFEATVYVDGVRAFIAENQGHGGCNFYHPINGAGRELLEKAEAHCKTLPHVTSDFIKDGEPFTYPQDLDVVVGNLFTEWLIAKEVKKELAKTVVVKTAEGKMLFYKCKISHPRIRSQLKEQHGDNITIVNDMPIADAVKIYMENNL